MCPIIPIRTALAANATDFPLRDSLFETIKEPSVVQFGIAADATGVLATIYSGPDVLVEEAPVSVKTINIMPVFPDDFIEDNALPGDKLSIKIRDTTGAARVVMTQVRINPLT